MKKKWLLKTRLLTHSRNSFTFCISIELLFKDTNDSEIYKFFELLDRYEVLRVNTNDCNQIKITVENFTKFIEIAFNFEIENLKTNIMSFINQNFDYLYENNYEDIKDFNERTDNKLLDVLTSNKPNYKVNNSDLVYFYVEWKKPLISVSKKIVENQCNYSLMTSRRLCEDIE